MSSLPVHQGHWRDWSSSGQQLLTVNSRASSAITNAIAFWLGSFVLGACWSMIAFTFHRHGDRIAPKCKNDGLHRHHRLIWRNVSDPFSAMTELLTVGCAWSRTTIPPDRLVGTKMSRSSILVRTTLAASVPILLFGGLSVASVFAANIAISGGNVLIKAQTKGNCGFLEYQTSGTLNAPRDPAVVLSYASKVLEDTIAGRAYARACYSNDFASTVSCGFFVKPSLVYSFYQQTKADGCPFGNADVTFDLGPCNVTRNEGAYVMQTPLLNSDHDLGINASPEHQVTFQKNTTCSIVNPKTYESSTVGYGTSPYNYTYQAYCLGPIGQDVSGPCSLDTSTFFYNPAEVGFDVGYTTKVSAVIYLSNSSYNGWYAIPEFRRSDGDTTLVSISANSIEYAEKVYDPLFLATSPINAGPGVPFKVVYQPYYFLNIVGCVDQYSICNPRYPSKCSRPSGITSLVDNMANIGLNEVQTATAFRIIVMLQNANTYANTYSTGDEALKASDRALNNLSLQLPYDQWITEVRGWFEIGLAKLQAYAVQYAVNTGNEGDAASVEIPNVSEPVRKAFIDQCAAQKIKLTSGYRNMSLLGLIIVLVIGGILWVAGLLLHPAILPMWRKVARPGGHASDSSTKHQHDYKADSKYHLYFMAIEDRDKPYRYAWHGGYPTFIDNPSIDNPRERAPSAGGTTDGAIVYQYTARPGMTAQANPPNASAQNQAPLLHQGGQQAIPLQTLTSSGQSRPLQNSQPTASHPNGPAQASSSQSTTTATGHSANAAVASTTANNAAGTTTGVAPTPANAIATNSSVANAQAPP